MYPMRDSLLYRSAWRSFALSLKSCRNHRSCVRTEFLSDMIFVAAQKLSSIYSLTVASLICTTSPSSLKLRLHIPQQLCSSKSQHLWPVTTTTKKRRKCVKWLNLIIKLNKTYFVSSSLFEGSFLPQAPSCFWLVIIMNLQLSVTKRE